MATKPDIDSVRTLFEKDEIMTNVWSAKDALSAKYGHDVKTFAAAMREGEKHSHHKVVNLEIAARPN